MILSGTRPANHHRLPAAGDCADQPRNRVFERHKRGQDRPVGPGQPRRLDLALEDGNLVTQEQDLGIFGPIAAGEKGEPAEDVEHRQISDS